MASINKIHIMCIPLKMGSLPAKYSWIQLFFFKKKKTNVSYSSYVNSEMLSLTLRWYLYLYYSITGFTLLYYWRIIILYLHLRLRQFACDYTRPSLRQCQLLESGRLSASWWDTRPPSIFQNICTDRGFHCVPDLYVNRPNDDLQVNRFIIIIKVYPPVNHAIIGNLISFLNLEVWLFF